MGYGGGRGRGKGKGRRRKGRGRGKGEEEEGEEEGEELRGSGVVGWRRRRREWSSTLSQAIPTMCLVTTGVFICVSGV